MKTKEEKFWNTFTFGLIIIFVPLWVYAVLHSECGILSNLECEAKRIRILLENK
ncbi:MAG: hypothetical protein HRU18_01305 [Pseudoalteromonas sp.]|uniref:hypothetical protein n=1 Tax=Pseudoalteromonas sp. TaxID=53249 RepID=UPI001D7F1D7E|nr:hypothetical protein [Pseudoalteromonas sp.]NRA76817.1 hypothetical protein [Pseudoalteromonas sp.]